jgi:hypothetical protein
VDKNFILLTKNKFHYIKQNELHSVLRLQNMQKFAKLTELLCAVSFSNVHTKSKLMQDNDSYEEQEESCRGL